MKNIFISGPVSITSFFISTLFALLALFPTSVLAWAQIPPDLENPSSNVIFLPGLEGSRLYRNGIISENQLWEPNRNADAEKLFLDSNGQSIDQSIYTRDIINTTNIGLGLFDKDIYRNFSDSMNQLVTDDIINTWEPIPYDWRKDLNDLVTNGIKIRDRYVYLIPEIERMASSSKTGKVTIITHSNGGLLAKVLIDKLEIQGKENLIDKLIMVAPPELGTPKAINVLLHGDEGSLPLVLNKSVARRLGENMGSAYNLLPTKKYFDTISAPVVQFDSSVDRVNNFRAKYGNSIQNYSALSDFLLAKKDLRPKPEAIDTDSPNVLNTVLIDGAKTAHTFLDNWVPPSAIQVTEIAGWGLPTTRTLEYYAKENCLIGQITCSYNLDHNLLKTVDGDGTVVSPSVMTSGTKVYLNIHDYNEENRKNINHGNILEARVLDDFIGNIIKNEPNILPINISTIKPTTADSPSFEISAHSPVSIDAYDHFGNHTGLVASADPTFDIKLIEANIPNSSYEEIGEGKYLDLAGRSYNIKITGLDLGSFTLREKVKQGDIQLADNIFADIPVTPMTTAQLDIVATSSIVSVPPILSIDINGDGIVDATTSPATEISPASNLLLIKKMLLGLTISDSQKAGMLNKIDQILNLISQGKVRNANKKISDFHHDLETKLNRHQDHHPNVSPEDFVTLADLLSRLLDSLAI